MPSVFHLTTNAAEWKRSPTAPLVGIAGNTPPVLQLLRRPTLPEPRGAPSMLAHAVQWIPRRVLRVPKIRKTAVGAESANHAPMLRPATPNPAPGLPIRRLPTAAPLNPTRDGALLGNRATAKLSVLASRHPARRRAPRIRLAVPIVVGADLVNLRAPVPPCLPQQTEVLRVGAHRRRIPPPGPIPGHARAPMTHGGALVNPPRRVPDPPLHGRDPAESANGILPHQEASPRAAKLLLPERSLRAPIRLANLPVTNGVPRSSIADSP